MKELLCPAGNLEKMKAAILYGADAVYLASDMFGMRAAADNFTLEQLKDATEYAHARGVKIYVTVNTMPHTNEYARLKKYLLEYNKIGVDALIISDLGVFLLISLISSRESSLAKTTRLAPSLYHAVAVSAETKLACVEI